MVVELIHVDSPNVSYSGDQITVDYEYSTTSVKKIENRLVVSTIDAFDVALSYNVINRVQSALLRSSSVLSTWFTDTFHSICFSAVGWRLHQEMCLWQFQRIVMFPNWAWCWSVGVVTMARRLQPLWKQIAKNWNGARKMAFKKPTGLDQLHKHQLFYWAAMTRAKMFMYRWIISSQWSIQTTLVC